MVQFKGFAKSIVMIILTLILMRTEKRFLALIWIIVLSIGFYSTKGGIFTLMTGGQFRVWGPPGSLITGNNELAIATLMILPLMRYLALTTENLWIRWGLSAAAVLSLASVVGSYSRGAFLALAVLGIAWWWKSRRRITFGVIAIVAAVAVMPLIPAKWYDRMPIHRKLRAGWLGEGPAADVDLRRQRREGSAHHGRRVWHLPGPRKDLQQILSRGDAKTKRPQRLFRGAGNPRFRSE